MDGLNLSFGLTVPQGRGGADRAFSDLLRALDIADAAGAGDAMLIAARISSRGPAAAKGFALVLEELSSPSDPLAKLISDVIERTGIPALKPVMLLLETRQRQAMTHAAAAALTPPALIVLAQATAQSFGIAISQPLLELIAKLAREAQTLPGASRAHADQSFRSLIDHLVTRWSETQVNSDATGFADMFETQQEAKSTIAPEPSRVIALSLESGSVGPVVWAALKEHSLTEAGVREIIGMISRAPAGRARDMLAEQITTPGRLMTFLQDDAIDFDGVDMMVDHLGINAAGTLLNELVVSDNRATRRALMDRLVKLGPEIAPLVNERLTDGRWYVVRNMITLLRECGCMIDQSTLDRYATHADARVRREMLNLRMDNPATREGALGAALQDKDKGVLRAALQVARSNFPPGAVSILARRVVEADFPPEFRVMALYLLGKSGHVSALEALLSFANGGKSMLGKAKLANKTPEMLAAVSGLARTWSTERRAREFLDLAAKSKDPQILNALQAVGGGE